MKKIVLATALLLAAMTGKAQEQVIDVTKTDGTSARTRLADLTLIKFLEARDTTMVMKLTNGADIRTDVNDVEEMTFADTLFNFNSSGLRILENASRTRLMYKWK